MGEILYRIDPIHVIGFYLMPLAAILPICILVKWVRNREDAKQAVLWLKRARCCLLALQFVFLVLYGYDFATVYLPYRNGNYLTVSGSVTELEYRTKYMSFSVGEIDFAYGIKEASMTHPHEKYLSCNGQLVRIGYVPRGNQNCVVLIELL